jgi:phosphatidate cytidylyltransferase
MGMALGRDSFTDLSTRILTGVAIAVVGLGAVWAGSPWFTLFVAAVIGVLVWELARMMGAPRDRALGLGASAGVLLLSAKLLPTGLGLPLLFLTGFAGLSVLSRNRTLFFVLTTLVLLASFGLITHRDAFGLTWMLWLVLVVAVTDIGGYFAGRIIGGPKFWPSRQPQENMVGHGIAGWVMAAAIAVADGPSWRSTGIDVSA